MMRKRLSNAREKWLTESAYKITGNSSSLGCNTIGAALNTFLASLPVPVSAHSDSHTH
jgi:hypothetical protein